MGSRATVLSSPWQKCILCEGADALLVESTLTRLRDQYASGSAEPTEHLWGRVRLPAFVDLFLLRSGSIPERHTGNMDASQGNNPVSFHITAHFVDKNNSCDEIIVGGTFFL